jgi:hypothetical protein
MGWMCLLLPTIGHRQPYLIESIGMFYSMLVTLVGSGVVLGSMFTRNAFAQKSKPEQEQETALVPAKPVPFKGTIVVKEIRNDTGIATHHAHRDRHSK